MGKIAFYEGIGDPFSGTKRKSRRGHGRKSHAFKKQQSKMKTCAAKYRKGGKRINYRAFMRSCLRK